MVKLIADYKIEGVESSDLDELLSWIETKHTVCLDVETTPKRQYRNHPAGGLSPHLSKIVMFQIGDNETQFVIDVRTHRHVVVKLKKYLLDPFIKKVGHNIKFDYQMILSNFGWRIDHIADTMIQEMVLHCGHRNYGYSLEKLAKRYLSFRYSKTNQLDLFSDNSLVSAMSKSTRTEFKKIGKNPFSKIQVLYGAKDVESTYSIYLKQLEKIAEEQLSRCVTFENLFTIALADIEYKGFYINTDKWIKQYEKNLRQYYLLKKEIFRDIKKLGVKQFLDFQMTLSENPEDWSPETDINLASSKQVIALCKALNIPTEIKDKKRSKELGEDIFKDSVEERHLKIYRKDYPLVDKYLRFKKLEKAVTTYGKQFLGHVNPTTGRIHSRFWQVLQTGRIASRDPNLQNIPNKSKFPGFRECFVAPPEHRLIVADYKGQESRILADIAQEDNMIDFFLHGDGDLHSHTARLMFKVPVNGETNTHLRQLAKILNFGIAYGMSAYKLSHDFQVSLDEAQEFINSFYASYPKLHEYFKLQHKLALKRGYILIDRFTGRKSYNSFLQRIYDTNSEIISRYKNEGKEVPSSVWSEYFTAKGQIGRNSQNYPIQGGGASMTKLACILFREKQKENNAFELYQVVNLVHDEIVVEAHKDYAKEAQSILGECMTKAGTAFVKKIPMLVDLHVGDKWEH